MNPDFINGGGRYVYVMYTRARQSDVAETKVFDTLDEATDAAYLASANLILNEDTVVVVGRVLPLRHISTSASMKVL